jgi:hypothetical protein
MKRSVSVVVILVAITTPQFAGARNSRKKPHPHHQHQHHVSPAVPQRLTASSGKQVQSGPIIIQLAEPIKIESASTANDKPVVVQLPETIKIDASRNTKSEDDSLISRLFGSGGAIGSILVFIAAIVGTFATYIIANFTRILTKSIADEDRYAKSKLLELELSAKRAAFEEDMKFRTEQFEKEYSEKRRQYDASYNLSLRSEENKMTIEEKRIAIELQRFGNQYGLSNRDSYLSALKFVHEQQTKEIQLLHSLADRLLSNNETDRMFAVLVLSSYVNADVIGRLAAGGEQIISTACLETLTGIEDDQISKVAKSILQLRNPIPPNQNEMEASGHEDQQNLAEHPI